MSENRVYVLTCEDNDWDETSGMVVLAPDAAEARRLADANAGPREGGRWLDPERTKIRQVRSDEPPHVVLVDFKSG